MPLRRTITLKTRISWKKLFLLYPPKYIFFGKERIDWFYKPVTHPFIVCLLISAKSNEVLKKHFQGGRVY